MRVGGRGPQIQFAEVAIFDDVNMSTMAAFILQVRSMHSPGRTWMSLDLALGSARLLGNSQTYPERLFLSLGVVSSPTKMFNSSANARRWEGRCWRGFRLPPLILVTSPPLSLS